MSSRALLNVGMIFAAMLAAILLHMYKPADEAPKAHALVPGGQNDIRAIEIERAGSPAIVLQREDAQWRMTAPVKARLDELWEDAPPEWQLLLLRFNFALFKSEVKGIPGSNNRLDQQPKGSLNVGLDHRWKALGQNFGSGFNFNYVPASRVQQTETLRREESARRQFDAYLSWASGSVRDGINWRLSMANLIPREASASTEGVDVVNHRLTESWSNNRTFRVISLRADMRF